MTKATPDEIEVFESLQRTTDITDFPRLIRRVSTHVDRIDEAQLDNASINAKLAVSIAGTLTTLMESARTLDASGRSTLRGAVEYFLLTGDADDDVSSPVGLEDDARVVNHACELLGRPDLVISI